MCGFAGIVHFDPRQPVEADRLRRMRDVLSHRGPDGRGLFIDGPVGLAHRRLAIVDVSAAGEQPMTNEDGSVWIAFNGEIYNHAELRPDLEATRPPLPHSMRHRDDPPPLRRRGRAVRRAPARHVRVRHLGHEAAAPAPRARPARHQAAVLRGHGRELLFGSEIKAMFAAGWLRPAFNDEIVPEFLATRFVSGEETFFRGVHKLLPGHTLSWSLDEGAESAATGSCRLRRTKRRRHVARGAGAATLRVRLRRRCRQPSDERRAARRVSLGRHRLERPGRHDGRRCSRAAPARSRSASRSAKRTSCRYARLAAERDRRRASRGRRVAGEFFESLPQLIWHEDEPIAFPSSVPLYFVSRLAREHVKVVLTGEGADELFLGYNRYRVTPWNDRLGQAVLAATFRDGAQAGAPPGARACRTLQPVWPSARFWRWIRASRSLFFENFAVFTEAMRERHAAVEAPRCSIARDPYAESSCSATKKRLAERARSDEPHRSPDLSASSC